MDTQGPTQPMPRPLPQSVVPAPIYPDPVPQAPPPPSPIPPYLPPVVPPAPKSPARSANWNWMWFWRGMLLVLVVLGILGGLLLHRATDFGQAISGQNAFSTQLGNGRVSMVFLGYGGPGHDGAYLSDSLLVATYDPATDKSALVSVPRDLWVQVPANSGNYSKLNTAFAYGVAHGGFTAGGQLAANKVSDILGLNISHWLSLDFTGFEQLVARLGGVDINVPDNFVATTSPTYSRGIRFHQGLTHMSGATALLFARARYCTPASEASDFARSARQQLLLKAIFGKLRSPGGWFAASGVMDDLQSRVHTDLSLRDLTTIFTHFDIDHATRIGLSNQNVLVDAVSDDGQDILLPRDGNWNIIRSYVQSQLGG